MKRFSFILTLLALMAFALPAAAQDTAPPANTITVTGSGSAAGTPDIAEMVLGVEKTNSDIGTAYNDVNTTLEAVIQALRDAGVAREDIRTANLSIFQDRGMMDPASSGMSGATFIVRNEVQITVRSIDLVPQVLNAALEAGANQVFGLNFSISDTTDLERAARSDAMADAETRAAELAALIGAEQVAVLGLEGQGEGLVDADQGDVDPVHRGPGHDPDKSFAHHPDSQ